MAKSEIRLIVPGMGSDHCAGIVRETLERNPDVAAITIRLGRHQVDITTRENQLTAGEAKRLVERAGYEVARAWSGDDADEDGPDADLAYLEKARRQLVLAMIPTTLIMLLMVPQMFWREVPGYLAIITLLAIPVVFVAGRETHLSAWRSLTNRKANMDALISLGSLPPFFIGLVGFFTPMTSFIEMAATIMAFHLLGRYLETRAKGRASEAIRKLLNLGAKSARVERDGGEEEVPICHLEVGDIMVIRPGEKIPTDGEIVDGSSHVVEALATGESLAVEKSIGDTVLGATINKAGRLKVKVTRLGDDTFLSQVIRLIEEAQGSKVPVQEFADRVTGAFVPAVFLIALASFGGWLLFPQLLLPVAEWGSTWLPWVDPTRPPLVLAILAGIAVLVISCPCALGLATPTALMVGSGIGAERGILIRSGEAIQTFKDLRHIVLDKTGTITHGKPELTDVIATGSNHESDVLRLAAALEAASEHPLAEAVVSGAKMRGLSIPEVDDFEALTARGVRGLVEGEIVYVGTRKFFEEQGIPIHLEEKMVGLEEAGKTAILVAVGQENTGLLAVADTIKESSIEAIAALKKLGLNPIMITGDNERTARAVGQVVGIEEIHAGALPEDKVEAIRRIQSLNTGRVAMVGDGINDAAALKQADIGIALGAGADVTIEAGDVTLVTGDLRKVVEAIELSRATFRKIVQNLFWAWIYNLVAVPVAAVGLLHPMIGVIAMSSSSLTVVGNSLLLKRTRFKPTGTGSVESTAQRKTANPI